LYLASFRAAANSAVALAVTEDVDGKKAAKVSATGVRYQTRSGTPGNNS